MSFYRTFEFSRVFVFSALFNFQDTLFRAFSTFSSRSHCLFIISYFLEFVKSFFLYFSELLTYSLQSKFSFPEKYFKTCFSQSACLLYHIFLCLSSFFEFFFSANLLTENLQISLTCLSLEATWLLYHIISCLSSLFKVFSGDFTLLQGSDTQPLLSAPAGKFLLYFLKLGNWFFRGFILRVDTVRPPRLATWLLYHNMLGNAIRNVA